MTTIEQSGHVADLLPEHVNGALSEELREAVYAHLAACAECRAERDEWLAIANASSLFSARSERAVRDANRSVPLDIPNDNLVFVDAKENGMPAESFTIPIRPRLGRVSLDDVGGVVRDWIRPALEVAVAAVFVFAIVGGFLVYRANQPNSTGNFAAVSSPGVTKDCSVPPRSSDDLVQSLNISDVLASNAADLYPALDEGLNASAGTLPSGSAPDQATVNAVTSLWAQFGACMAVDPARGSALLTETALRRLFYANVWTSLNNSALGAAETKTTGMPPSATAPVVTQSSLIAQPSKYALGPMIQMSDGRVFVSLVDASTSNGGKPVGYIVAARVNGAWLIDETRIYVG
jgi:anti-sigma factor RsiW